MLLKLPLLKLVFKIALITAGIIVLYQLSNLMLIYHYFSYEYYITIVAIIALIIGVVLSKFHASGEVEPITELIPAVVEKDTIVDTLTTKELQILALIHQGKTNKEIASLNFVELSTIKTHINNIYAKIEVSNRKEASRIYAEYAYRANSTFSPPS